MADTPSNVVDIRPDMRVPDRLSPDEALGYIRTLLKPISSASSPRVIDLTLESVRTVIEKALGPAD